VCSLAHRCARKTARRSRPRAKAAAAGAPQGVDALVAMGFDARKSADALEENGGDVQRAITWLFAHRS
jgi:uncharacterized UBP type Zn finger protein